VPAQWAPTSKGASWASRPGSRRIKLTPSFPEEAKRCSSSGPNGATISTTLSKLMTESFCCLGFATDGSQEGERPAVPAMVM